MDDAHRNKKSNNYSKQRVCMLDIINIFSIGINDFKCYNNCSSVQLFYYTRRVYAM